VALAEVFPHTVGLPTRMIQYILGKNLLIDRSLEDEDGPGQPGISPEIVRFTKTKCKVLFCRLYSCVLNVNNAELAVIMRHRHFPCSLMVARDM